MNECRICGYKTVGVLDLGKMPLANGFIDRVSDKEYFYHLTAVFCPECYMVQLESSVKPEVVFNENYHFISSTSDRMVDHFKKIAKEIIIRLEGRIKPFVVEVGSNDGIMLEYIAQKGINHLGVEPSANVAAMAKKKNVKVLVDFFNEKTASQIVKHFGQADIIFGANVFCHIEDINSVFRGINILLKKDGLFFFEDPYLADIIKKTSFDQFYADHAYYYSGLSVFSLAKRHNLDLIDVKRESVHGGSMRYYFKKLELLPPRQALKIKKWLAAEKKVKLDKLEGYKDLKKNVDKISQNLKKTLIQIKKAGHRIVGYGVTAKSSTILNYAQIGPDIIDYICDITPVKIDKYSPGMHIPIKSYDVFVKDRPAYSLLFAWNHKKEIYQKEKEYRRQGGKFINYIPKVLVE